MLHQKKKKGKKLYMFNDMSILRMGESTTTRTLLCKKAEGLNVIKTMGIYTAQFTFTPTFHK